MRQLILEAKKENLEQVLFMLDKLIQETDCERKPRRQLTMAVEEIFLNIASYAYPGGKDGEKEGTVDISMELLPEPLSLEVTFRDSGIPYDPLKKEDPNVHRPGMDRDIGGLGIFMVKKTMDKMEYAYQDGKNVLTIRKALLS